MKVALRAHWCWKTTSVAHRRATDGMLPRAARMGRLVRVVGGRVAWPVAVEVGAALDGAAVCRRSARRGVLDSHGRAVRRLSGLLLLSAERRAALAGIGPACVGAGPPSGVQGSTAGARGDRRFSDEALRPEGPGSRHSSRSASRSHGAPVLLRARLGDAGGDCAASLVGNDRTADLVVVVRSPAG